MSNPVPYIDSHSAGEPTRLILSGGPDLGQGPLSERKKIFAQQFDSFRSACVNEPRGSDVLVGALLCEPSEPDCSAGVIFFNNVGMLGMCGHGTMGLLVSLAYLQKLAPGRHRIDTPVGVVEATLESSSRVRVDNVPAYCHRMDVPLEVPGLGTVHGDIAYGGNWFFLVEDHGLEMTSANIHALTQASASIREHLQKAHITGAHGAEIDHIELIAPSPHPHLDARNFVLCPGLAYDRSPCGTGTSAKLACLAAKGKLLPGDSWKVESIIGSVFEGSYKTGERDTILPSVSGEAFVCTRGELIFNDHDPFNEGIRL